MEIVGWYVLAPLSIATLITGVALALASRWGLFRHYWVLVSLGGTAVAAGVLLAHLPDVSAVAERVQRASDAELASLGSDLFHAVLGLLVLLALLVLNVFKPRGATKYGWRREQQERAQRAAR